MTLQEVLARLPPEIQARFLAEVEWQERYDLKVRSCSGYYPDVQDIDF